jgi:predicted Rossmann fold nucleotide-binding protein DprA/Smf involved in DNA uptake
VTTSVSSSDQLAVILLCSALGRRSGSQPALLGPAGWARLARALDAAGFGPGRLLEIRPEQISTELGLEVGEAERLSALMRRAGPVSIDLERLADRGIWAMSALDPDYPSRLITTLGSGAPPVLFGSGERKILDQGGLAIIGSRDVDEEATEFAAHLARAAARGDTIVISGAARGIDTTAMAAALQAGGSVVGVLADTLDRRIRDADVREAISDQRLVLITPYVPSAGFSVRSAMGRNKVVYGLADAAVVVASALGEGGTWTGATEALKIGQTPVFVRFDTRDGGSRGLLERGANSLPDATPPDAVTPAVITAWRDSSSRSSGRPGLTDPDQPTLFGANEAGIRPTKRKTRRTKSKVEAVLTPAKTDEQPADPPRPSVAPIMTAETTTDALVEFGKAAALGAVGSVPILGPMLGALLTVTWPDLKAERLQRFAQELARDVESLREEIDQDFVSRADFVALAEEVLDQVARRRSDEKLVAYAAALANASRLDRPDDRTRERLLDLLDDLRPTHIQILARLAAEPPEWAPPGDAITVGQVAQSRQSAALAGLSADGLDMEDLERRGLLRSLDDQANLLAAAEDSRAVVSPLGKAFLEFITVETSEDNRRRA